MTVTEALLQQLMELLREALPDVSRKQHVRVAAVILGRSIDCGMDDLATHLLKSRLPVGELLAVLLRCESLTIQHLIEQPQSGGSREQVRLFSEWIEHFNHLQEAVINAAEHGWRSRVELERRARVLAECRAEWSESGKVHLHNYFKEVPVTARVPFVSFDAEHQLHVKASEDLGRVFSASEDPTMALISSPDRKYNIRVKAFVCKRMALTLSVTDVCESMQERRSEVRVALDEAVAVELITPGGRSRGVMADLSCGGLGLSLPAGSGLHRNERVQCRFQLAGNRVEIDQATVCWVHNCDNDLRTGIRISVNPVQRDVIYKYLFVLQQQIAGRIHQLVMPGWMR